MDFKELSIEIRADKKYNPAQFKKYSYTELWLYVLEYAYGQLFVWSE